MYDIWDTDREIYIPQHEVKEFCEKHNLLYVMVLYDGEFISWDHCKSYVGKSDIATDGGEGIVIKNQSKPNRSDERSGCPTTLKVVTDKLKETRQQNHKMKVEDPQKKEALSRAEQIVGVVVTRSRVEKHIHKLIDEGILPEKMVPEDMKLIAMHLPKVIYEDCVKEEPEMVKEAGEYFGRLCNKHVMRLARQIILGVQPCK